MALLVINIVFSLLGLAVLAWGIKGVRKLDKETNEIFSQLGIEYRV